MIEVKERKAVKAIMRSKIVKIETDTGQNSFKSSPKESQRRIFDAKGIRITESHNHTSNTIPSQRDGF
jgi:hypothetical protein